MDPNLTITCRVWHSPRVGAAGPDRYPWKWAVDDTEAGENMEFGNAETEEEAKRLATEARASWICIRLGIPQPT
jgi:hypothetical protein